MSMNSPKMSARKFCHVRIFPKWYSIDQQSASSYRAVTSSRNPWEIN